MQFLQNALDHAQRPVTGSVDVRLHKVSCLLCCVVLCCVVLCAVLCLAVSAPKCSPASPCGGAGRRGHCPCCVVFSPRLLLCAAPLRRRFRAGQHHVPWSQFPAQPVQQGPRQHGHRRRVRRHQQHGVHQHSRHSSASFCCAGQAALTVVGWVHVIWTERRREGGRDLLRMHTSVAHAPRRGKNSLLKIHWPLLEVSLQKEGRSRHRPLCCCC